MNKYLKSFLHRGLVFGGFGPIVAGVVFLCLELSLPEFSIGGGEVLIAIISTYLLAFVQAGASVFNQVETWSTAKSLLCHLSTIYAAYVITYLVNFWIPFEPMVILIFTLVFAAAYFVIWLSVYFSVKAFERRVNARLDREK